MPINHIACKHSMWSDKLSNFHKCVNSTSIIIVEVVPVSGLDKLTSD